MSKQMLVMIDGGMHKVMVPRFVCYVGDNGNWIVIKVLRPGAVATMTAMDNSAYPDLPQDAAYTVKRFLPHLLAEDAVETVGAFALGGI